MPQEHGYWQQDRGYFEFVDPPSPVDIASLPEGTEIVPKKPSREGYKYDWNSQEKKWDEFPIPLPTPEELREWMRPITARQLRLTLLRNGITPAMVEAELQNIPDELSREEALIEWEYASNYERLHPLIPMLATALGMTEEQADILWKQAEKA